MKSCIEKIVIIPLTMLAYANGASAQEKSTNLGAKNEKPSSIIMIGTPAPRYPNLTPKELTLNEQVKPWCNFNAGNIRLNWIRHHAKFVTKCSCACTFNFDANRRITNLKILKSSGSDFVDRDVKNTIKAAAPEKLQRLGDNTILVDFSNDPSAPNFPYFSLRLLNDAPAVWDTSEQSKSKVH